MKYKEFKEKMEQMNLLTYDRKLTVKVIDGGSGSTLVEISKNKRFWMRTDFNGQFKDSAKLEGVLINATKLACTPLEEREEEKLFIYCLPVDNTQGERGYLLKQTDYKMVIDYSSKDFVLENRMYQFSEEEVGRYSKIYHGLFDACIKEEVQ